MSDGWIAGDGFTMRLGSCFDPVTGLSVITDKSVDVTISDPPYSEHVENGQAVSGRRNGQAVFRKKKIGVGFLTDADVVALCAQLVRVTKRWGVVFCAWEQVGDYKRAIETAGGRYVRCCGWEKPDGTPQLTGDRPATFGEAFVVFYADGAPLSWNGKGKRGLYKYGVCRGGERTAHPTQKPLGLMLEIVEDFTNEGDLVLDPFAGSGSTGVACRMLRRRFVGWELQRNFFDIACRRIAGDEAEPIPEQLSLLAGVA